jgi:ribosomal-protein-alanine N-acetyltransferase
MKVEPAALHRADALAVLHASAFDRPWHEAELAELMRSPGVVALETDGGFIMVRLLGDAAEVLTLAVAPSARRRGAGRALVRAGLTAAEEAGAPTVVLEVAAGNAAAVALYESEGFERAGVRRGYYARAGQGAEDALLLRRTLKTPGA